MYSISRGKCGRWDYLIFNKASNELDVVTQHGEK